MSRSYRKTLFSFIATALTPVLLLCCLFSVITYVSTMKQIESYNESILTQVQKSNDIIFRELDATSLTLASNEDITSLMKRIILTGEIDYHQSLIYRTAKSFLSAQTNSREYIQSIDIVFENSGQRAFSSTGGIVELSPYFNSPQFWDSLSDSSLGTRVLPASATGRQNIITLVRCFYFGTPSARGAIVLNLDKSYMERTLHELSETNQADMFAECDGAFLFQSNPKLSEKWADTLPELNSRTKAFFHASLDGTKYVVSKTAASQYGIHYYMITNERQLYTVPYTIFKIIGACSILLIILSVLLVWLLNRRQYSRLEHIVNILRAEGSEEVPDLDGKKYDEYEYIARRIQDNYLLQKFFQIELSEKSYKQKYSELVALQSQINPHMLYNTLEVIQWKSYRLTDTRNEVVMMLEALSSLLKYSLSPADSFVTLGEEIDHTVNYVRLLKLRYPQELEIQ